MNTRNIIIGAVVAILVGFALGWALHTNSNLVSGVSSSGISNSTAKIASITMAPLLAAGTSTSIYNGDSTDRAIVNSFAVCTNVGSSVPYLTGMSSGSLPSLTVLMSTSTVTGQGLAGNLSYAAVLNIATTSITLAIASTTDPVNASAGRIWPSATYLNVVFNATNTAACTVGVNYLSL